MNDADRSAQDPYTPALVAAIVDSAMDAIITVDRDQRIVLFNRAAEAMFRCARELALGDRLDRFIPSRFRDAWGVTRALAAVPNSTQM